MGYAEKLQQLCDMRGLYQADLARLVDLPKSSISRILSGTQEPKLMKAYELARLLGVTLDYIADDSRLAEATDRLVMVTEEEHDILKIVRRLGTNAALDRLLNVGPGQKVEEPGPPSASPQFPQAGEEPRGDAGPGPQSR